MWVAEAGRLSGQLLEVAGIAVISIGILIAFIRAGVDIIRTVTTTPELKQVFVLGLIVLVRTFLSFSLQMELEGKWPWQRASG